MTPLRPTHWPRPGRPPRRGSTLVEAILSLLVVSLVAAAALEATGATARATRAVRERQTAERLAEAMLAEVTSRPYPKPNSSLLGTLLGSLVGIVNRTGLVQIDAYDNFTESPPRAPDGRVLTTEPGWSRSVRVFNVNHADPSQASVSDTGLKRIVVTVSRSGRVLATRTALKAADD